MASRLPVRIFVNVELSRLRLQLYPAAIVTLFVLSRAVALSLGLHYSSVELVWFWQVLDLDVLHHHLLRGLLNLHGQPPLYNALTGVALKLAGDRFGKLLLSFQFLLGLVASLALYYTLVRLRLHRMVSFAIAVLVLLNPSTILFEFDALYTQLVYAGLTVLTLAVTCFVQTNSPRWLALALTTALLLTLTRATYQWVWLMGLSGLLWWFLPLARQRIARFSVVFVALALLWPLKNFSRFHHFTSSTWAPYSLAKHWDARDPRIAAWADAGELPTFTYSESQGAEQENAWLSSHWGAAPRGAPELDSLTKFAGGPANWNSLALLCMHDAQLQDVKFLLRHDPGSFLTETYKGMRLYFEPTSRYFLISQNEAAAQYHLLAPLTHAIDRICCNTFGLPPDFRSDYRPASQAAVKDHSTAIQNLQRLCLSALAGAILLLAALAASMRSKLWLADPDRRIVILLISWTIVWVFLVTTVVETGENMRFRFETQSLAIIVIATFLQHLWERRRA